MKSPISKTKRKNEEHLVTHFNEIHTLSLRLKFIYSLVGLFLGLSCIISGSILSLYGVTGHASFVASLLGLSTQLNDAAPGVVIFVVGIFIVFITRFRIKQEVHHKPDGEYRMAFHASVPFDRKRIKR